LDEVLVFALTGDDILLMEATLLMLPALLINALCCPEEGVDGARRVLFDASHAACCTFLHKSPFFNVSSHNFRKFSNLLPSLD
jgi:hypothetical protein